MVWTCFPFIRSDQNDVARHNERGKKTRQAEKEVERQHQEIDKCSPSPKGGVENREKWSKLVVELKWRPNDPRGYGIDEGNVKVKARINPQCRSKLR